MAYYGFSSVTMSCWSDMSVDMVAVDTTRHGSVLFLTSGFGRALDLPFKHWNRLSFHDPGSAISAVQRRLQRQFRSCLMV